MKHVILFGLLSITITIMPADKGKQIIIDSSDMLTYQTGFNTKNSNLGSPLLLVNLSDKPIKNFHKQVPEAPDQDFSIKPFTLGGKEFNSENLKNVSSEDVNKLLAMAYPSMAGRWYGKNDQTVTREDLTRIDTMLESVRSDLQFKILPTQGSCCMSEERYYSDRCRSSYALKGSVAGSLLCMAGFIAGGIWAMHTHIPTSICCKMLALKILLPSLTLIPTGCIAGEITSCICNRCCREKEVWAANALKNENK